MRVYMCDVCHSTAEDAHEAGWFYVAQMLPNDAARSLWELRTKDETIGTYCSMSCLMRWVEGLLIEKAAG